MTQNKRPKLGAVLRGDRATSPAEATPTPAVPTPAPSAPEKTPSERQVQLNVIVPEDLRRRVRIKALEQGTDVSVIVRQLLIDWLNDA